MHVDKSSYAASFLRGLAVQIGPHNLLTGSARRIEMEVGEAVEMACPAQLTYQWQLIRKPTGSNARLDEARLVAVDKPGVYTIRVETREGGWSRYLEICAYSYEQMHGTCTRRTDEARERARAWLNDPARTTDEVVRKLEQ